MGIAMTLGVGSLTLLLQSMPVDFRIDGTPPSPPVTQVPASLASPEAPADGNPAPRPVRRGPALAVGYGRDVPLEFAVRQITPHWLHVNYSDDVDGQVRVSWHGGKPWNQVLGGVLTPLGLHMKMCGRTLWIRG